MMISKDCFSTSPQNIKAYSRTCLSSNLWMYIVDGFPYNMYNVRTPDLKSGCEDHIKMLLDFFLNMFKKIT